MMAAPKSILRVFQPEARLKQNCAVCHLQSRCYAPTTTTRHIVLNLLTCRLQRNLERDKTAALILELVRPKLASLTAEVVKSCGADPVDVLRDLESKTIEILLERYVMGDVGYPLHFLFFVPNGAILREAGAYAARVRKWNSAHLPISSRLRWLDPDEETWREVEIQDETYDMNEVDNQAAMSHLAKDVNSVIDDGLTLKTAEYRVIRFCLDNASDSARPLNGLHMYLSRQMGVVRTRCTRIWSESCKKIASIIGRDRWIETTQN